MKERFEQLYARNEWGLGSGEGSLPVNTQGYIEFLESFLREHDIAKVVDLGCGDWQFSRLIDWGRTEYHGFDLVTALIERNRAEYARPNVEFHHYSGDFEELPGADLLLVKDVLQHWSNASIAAFRPTLRRYRYSLITNCVDPRGETENIDIADGGFRYLDLRRPPFNLDADELFSFTNRKPRWLSFLQRTRWRKKVLLVTGRV